MTLHHSISYYFLSFPLISLASFSAALVYFVKKSRPIKNVVVIWDGNGSKVRDILFTYILFYLHIYLLFIIYYLIFIIYYIYLLLNKFNLLPHNSIQYIHIIHNNYTTLTLSGTVGSLTYRFFPLLK